jgi:hypothetical protein
MQATPARGQRCVRVMSEKAKPAEVRLTSAGVDARYMRRLGTHHVILPTGLPVIGLIP